MPPLLIIVLGLVPYLNEGNVNANAAIVHIAVAANSSNCDNTTYSGGELVSKVGVTKPSFPERMFQVQVNFPE